MKRTLLLILLFALSLSGPESSSSQTADIKDRFTAGLVGWFIDPLYTHNKHHTEWINFLGVDALISYSKRNDNSNEFFGGFLDDIAKYRKEVDYALGSGLPSGLTRIFERAKIVRPAYGQRSTYHAEPMPDNAFPRYYYSTHETGEFFDENFKGENVSGWKCEKNRGYGSGYMVKDLIENCEQVQHTDTSKQTGDVEYFVSDNKRPGWKWFVCPRMRIDKNIANDKKNAGKTVVTIEVVNFEGSNPLQSGYSIPVKVSDFKKGSSAYDGSYTDRFFDGNDVIEFAVKADYLCKGRNTKPLDSSKVDFRIYWNGEVGVYLDYVRVEDEWAHYLFNPDLDRDKKFDFINKINEEVDAFASQSKIRYFYMDECPINSFPCIAEVNRLIKKRSGNSNTGIFAILMEETAMHDYGKIRFIPDREQYVKYLLSLPDFLTDVFLYTSYPFKDSSLYPSNLNIVQPRNEFIDYFRASNPSEYNFDLENNTLENNYRANAQAMNSYRILGEFVKQSRIQGRYILPMYFIQVHSWESHAAQWGRNTYILREPTNEEILLQGNLAIIYGAKSINYFCYNTDVVESPLNKKNYHNFGLIDDSEARKQRELNYFGQKKWEGIKDITEKLHCIGNILYPPGDTINHLLYVDSRTVNLKKNNREGNDFVQTGFPFFYIDKINSIYTDYSSYILSDTACSNCDTDNQKFWEFGFFNPNPLSGDTLCKYFIALNKRCTPVFDYKSDDFRSLQIKFLPDYFKYIKNWIITDEITKKVIGTFDFSAQSFINLGIFGPAEARLFKISPSFD